MHYVQQTLKKPLKLQNLVSNVSPSIPLSPTLVQGKGDYTWTIFSDKFGITILKTFVVGIPDVGYGASKSLQLHLDFYLLPQPFEITKVITHCTVAFCTALSFIFFLCLWSSAQLSCNSNIPPSACHLTPDSSATKAQYLRKVFCFCCDLNLRHGFLPLH